MFMNKQEKENNVSISILEGIRDNLLKPMTEEICNDNKTQIAIVNKKILILIISVVCNLLLSIALLLAILMF